ncbi:hypothetical protein ACK31H_20660, partial [Aeromonas caviae]
VLNIAPRLPLKLRGAKCLDLQGANLGSEYKTRRSDGVITNIVLTDEVEEFMPKPVMFTP